MMHLRSSRLVTLLAVLLAIGPQSAFAKDQKPGQAPPISKETKLALVRLLSSEFVWTRKPLPMGEGGIAILPNGDLSPNGDDLNRAVMAKGQAAKQGERVQITNVTLKGSEILLEINGGGKKKTKWYDHLQVGLGGTTAQTPQNTEIPKGSYLAIEYKGYIPEMTLEELKARIAPVFDFSVK